MDLSQRNTIWTKQLYMQSWRYGRLSFPKNETDIRVEVWVIGRGRIKNRYAFQLA